MEPVSKFRFRHMHAWQIDIAVSESQKCVRRAEKRVNYVQEMFGVPGFIGRRLRGRARRVARWALFSPKMDTWSMP